MALGRILDSLGHLSGAVGCTLVPLGCLWGASWASLGRSWPSLGRLVGPLENLLGDLGSIFKGFRKGLGGFGGRSGPQNNCSFVFQRTSPLNIKIQLSASPKMQDNKLPSLWPPIGLGGIREA